jgi:hypothetical protein
LEDGTVRPQLTLYRVTAALLLFSTIAVADQFYSRNFSPLEHKMHVYSLYQLKSYVQELCYGDLLNVNDFRTQGFPQEQLACQRAITHGSFTYVRKWIDATEGGMTPEDANLFAARQLEDIVSACNVPVVENAEGIRIPSAGGPCSTSTSHSFVDSNELRECLQQTLEFWSSYLYIPADQ